MKYIHTEEIHNEDSSRIILPEVLKYMSVNSVLDIGCGIGTWLATINNFGIEDVYGVDGEYVDRELLRKYLNPKLFLPFDLTLPLKLSRTFDLAICLEVAEHLPESSAKTLVNSLINHSDVILFSAAIPGQGGQNHLNEQWPDYWAKLFEEHNYLFLDIIRPIIWDNPEVDYWYKQNIFLVVKSNHVLTSKYSASHLSLIHPELFKRVNQNKDKQITSLKKQLAINPFRRLAQSIFK